MDNIIDVYYFSGTGSTKAIVEKISDMLVSKNLKVNTYAMENGFHTLDKMASKIIFAFPANSQSVSPLVWRFFKSLPKVSGMDAFIITTLNESVYITKPLCKLLKQKGYNPKATCIVSMPKNMLDSPIDERQDSQRNKNAMVKIDSFVNTIVFDRQFYDSEYQGSRIVSFLSRCTLLPWLFMRLAFKLEVKKEKCKRCEICEIQCPVGNITLKEHPIHGNKCEFCMRCAANCPNKAVYIKGKGNISIRKYQQA